MSSGTEQAEAGRAEAGRAEDWRAEAGRVEAGRVEDWLMRVLPAAASLGERRQAHWLQPATDRPDIDESKRQWKLWADSVSGGDEAAMLALLESRGIPVDRARQSLAPMSVVPGSELPPWACALGDLLRAALAAPPREDVALVASLTTGGSFRVTSESSIPVKQGFGAEALAAFVAPLRSWPGAESIAGSTHIPRYLYDELVCHTLSQLLLACLPVLRSGAIHLFDPEQAPFEAWASTLERFPALGRILGVIVANGRVVSAELIARLGDDHDELQAIIAATARMPHRLAVCTGDRHDNGRFVLPVTFAGDRRLLYKPKDLRAGGVLAKLVRQLGFEMMLPERLERKNYVWEAFVEERLPGSEAQWAELAREVGRWTSLFELLGTSDMIGSNAIVSGGHLVPVDTETLLTFLFVPAESLRWQPPGSGTGLISAPMPSRNPLPLGDMGMMANPDYLPLLDHLDATQRGYAEMQARLAARREVLAETFDTLAGVPLRAVVRNTWVYFQLMMESVAPDALTSGVARDLVLERLWRAQIRYSLPVALVEAEIEALRDMNVPLFRFLPGRRDLIGPGGTTAVEALSEAPLDRVRRRLEALEPEPSPADLDSIAAQFFCGSANARPRVEGSGAAPDGDGGSVSTGSTRGASSLGGSYDEMDSGAHDWKAEAVRVGDELLDILSHGGPDGDRLNAGIMYMAHNRLFGLSALRPVDLLSGSVGIALVLAELARLTGMERFAAEASLQGELAIPALRASAEEICKWTRTRVGPPLGGMHWGLPALLYQFLHLPTELATARSAGEANEAGEALSLVGKALANFDAGSAYGTWDWLKGAMVPSLLLVMSVAGCDRRNPAACELLTTTEELREGLAELLIAKCEHLWPDPKPNSLLAALFPSSNALLALALSRQARCLGKPAPEPVASWLAGWRREQSDENPADLAVARELSYENGLDVPATSMAGDDVSLPTTCFACLGVIDENLSSVRRGLEAAEQSASLRSARMAGSRILASRKASGRWFRENVAPDRFRLSALWGLAAVVHAFAGLADPQGWYSLRLLQDPLRHPGDPAGRC